MGESCLRIITKIKYLILKRYIHLLVAHEVLNLHLIDVATTYLYDSLDNDIYMKLYKGYKKDYSIKLSLTIAKIIWIMSNF
ncbi:hypothetical protein CR513_20284, partial [Mucuna pruriens]